MKGCMEVWVDEWMEGWVKLEWGHHVTVIDEFGQLWHAHAVGFGVPELLLAPDSGDRTQTCVCVCVCLCVCVCVCAYWGCNL